VVNIVEILIHWKAGRKKAEVARSLGVDRGTVAKYTAKAQAEGYLPGGDQLSAQEWGMLVDGWFPELVDPRHRSLTHGAVEAHRSVIEEMLKTNTATTVHQRLRDEHGLTVGLTSFRRYVWREFPEENLEGSINSQRRRVQQGRRVPGQRRGPPGACGGPDCCARAERSTSYPEWCRQDSPQQSVFRQRGCTRE
jgi:hypothetical protein